MKSFRGLVVKNALLPAAIIAANAAVAAPFDAEFQVVETTATCEIKKPDGGTFEPVVKLNRYAYGSTIRTLDKSSCVVKFAEANGCLVYEKTKIEFTQADGGKTKILVLSEGGVDLDLAKGFRTDNDLRVKTPNATVNSIACGYTVEYQVVGDLKTTFVSVTEGEVSASGKYFSITEADAGDKFTIAESPDGDIIRIRVTSGEITVIGRDVGGTERKVVLRAGDFIEIVVKPTSDAPSAVARRTTEAGVEPGDGTGGGPTGGGPTGGGPTGGGPTGGGPTGGGPTGGGPTGGGPTGGGPTGGGPTGGGPTGGGPTGGGAVDVIYRVVPSDPEQEQVVWDAPGLPNESGQSFSIGPAASPASSGWGNIAITPPVATYTPVGNQ